EPSHPLTSGPPTRNSRPPVATRRTRAAPDKIDRRQRDRREWPMPGKERRPRPRNLRRASLPSAAALPFAASVPLTGHKEKWLTIPAPVTPTASAPRIAESAHTPGRSSRGPHL